MDMSLGKYPQSRRLALAVIFLAVLIAFGTLVCPMTVRLVLFGKLAEPDYSVLAIEGQPFVEAAYRFKSVRGLWPQSFQELIPEFAAKSPPKGWILVWSSSGGIRISKDSGYAGIRAAYETWGPECGWHAVSRDGSSPIRYGPSALKVPPLPTNSVLDEMFREFDRRITKMPGELIHHQGKISRLVKAGRLQEARESCNRCSREFPDHWWPALVLANISVQENRSDQAFSDLERWVSTHKSMYNYWRFSHFALTQGQTATAKRAIVKAASLVETPGSDVDLTPDALGFCAAALAYKLREFDAALAICSSCDYLGPYTEPSYLAIRSAANLAIGNIDVAMAELEKLHGMEKQRVLWTENIAELHRAIQTSNRGYSFDPGVKFCEDLDLLVPYE